MKFYYLLVLLLLSKHLTICGQTAFGSGQIINNSESPAGAFGSVLTNDLDGDGDEDVIFLFEYNDTIAWYENDGFGNFNSQKKIIDVDVDYFRSIYVIDLDGDGYNDVLTSSLHNWKVAWYKNDGLGNFGPQKIITTSAYGTTYVYAIDLDGDGDQDVLSASSSPNLIAWYENDGLGNFGPPKSITTAANFTYSIYAIDLDGDGDMDVLSASHYDDEIAWYENDGLGNFGPQKIISTNVWGASQVYAVDISGDGIPDVLSASQYDGKIAWYKNDGYGNFGSQRIISTSTLRAQSMYAKDLDNDGDQDVLCAISYTEIGLGRIVWFENNGGGNFGSMQVINEEYSTGHISVYAADIDGDNDMDVIGANKNQEVFWHENFLGLEFTTIKGSIYWDKINDNNFNVLEDKAFVGIKVSEQPEGRISYTNLQGDYNLTLVNTGTHTITVPTPVIYDCIAKIDFTLNTPSNPFTFNSEVHTHMDQDYVFTGLDRDCRKLSGIIFDDENSNGILDNGENGIPGILLNIDSYGSIFSQSDGRFSVYLPNNDSYSITLNLLNNFATNGYCQGINITQTFPFNNMGYMIPSNSGNQSNLTFGVNQGNGSNFFDVGLYTLGVNFGNKAGETFHSWMDFKSVGLTDETCTLRINHDPLLTLLNADIPISNQGADFVEWVFPNGSAPLIWCMQMDWYLDSSAVAGNNIHWEAIYKCGSDIDSCLQNDRIIRDVTIDIGPLRQREEVATLFSMHSEGSMPEVINKDEVLSYVITFKNPLETIAYNVTIIDQLPNNLDLSTISLPFSSFPNYDFTIKESGEMILELNDINLSDASIDELNSYGFVQFNVRLKKDLPDGTIIPNKATVYFNGIEPTETNEIIHRLDNSAPVINHLVNDVAVAASVFPNPFSNTTTFVLNKVLPFNYNLKMFDVLGKEVKSYENLSATSFTIEKGNLPSGLYFLNVYEYGKVEVLGSYKLVVQ